MDALAKLFNKLSLKEQLALLQLFEDIKDPKKRETLDMKKLTGGEFYRVRKGKFRVIFHHEGGRTVIDATRLRNEKTYRDY